MRNSYSPAFPALASPAKGFWPSAAFSAKPRKANPARPMHRRGNKSIHHRLDMNSPSRNLPHSTLSNRDYSFGNLGRSASTRHAPSGHGQRASWDGHLGLSTLKACPHDGDTPEGEGYFP